MYCRYHTVSNSNRTSSLSSGQCFIYLVRRDSYDAGQRLVVSCEDIYTLLSKLIGETTQLRVESWNATISFVTNLLLFSEVVAILVMHHKWMDSIN